jgi:hypothetical protein
MTGAFGESRFELREKLRYIQEEARTRDVKLACSLLQMIRFEIFTHLVEQERRFATILASNDFKEDRAKADMIKHYALASKFLERELPKLQRRNDEEEARNKIWHFTDQLINAIDAEELVLFRAALRRFEHGIAPQPS